MAYCPLPAPAFDFSIVAARSAIGRMRRKHRNVGLPSTKGEGEEQEASKASILQENEEDGMT